MTDQEKIAQLKQWVVDLQTGMYINCVYCGHRYGPVEDTPQTKAQMLKDHIEKCPEHPMSELRQEIYDEFGDEVKKKLAAIKKLKSESSGSSYAYQDGSEQAWVQAWYKLQHALFGEVRSVEFDKEK